MDLVKLCEPGQEANNHSVLLSNLQKLEDAGKISSKEVSAKDIMSGIISAANRKMLRSQNKSTSKKDSVGNETSKSTPKLDLEKSSGTSRRNSESVFHGAVAIAAAVPQLMVNAGNSMSTSNLPTAVTGASVASEKLSIQVLERTFAF